MTGFEAHALYGFEMVDAPWNGEQHSSIENLRENRIDRFFPEFSTN